MKIKKTGFLRNILFLSVLFHLPLHSAAAQEIHVAAADQFGAFAPLIVTLLDRAGFVPLIQFYPAQRSLKMLLDGDVDMEFFRVRQAVESIANDIHLIGPVVCADLSAFARVDNPVNIEKIEDLAGYTIAVSIGNKITQAVAHQYRQDVQIVTLHDSLYRMLDAGRFDIVLDPDWLGFAEINNLKLGSRIKRVGPVLKSEPAYLVLRHKHKGWQERIEKALLAMKKSGEWKRKLGDLNESQGFARNVAAACLGLP